MRRAMPRQSWRATSGSGGSVAASSPTATRARAASGTGRMLRSGRAPSREPLMTRPRNAWGPARNEPARHGTEPITMKAPTTQRTPHPAAATTAPETAHPRLERPDGIRPRQERIHEVEKNVVPRERIRSHHFRESLRGILDHVERLVLAKQSRREIPPRRPRTHERHTAHDHRETKKNPAPSPPTGPQKMSARPPAHPPELWRTTAAQGGPRPLFLTDAVVLFRVPGFGLVGEHSREAYLPSWKPKKFVGSEQKELPQQERFARGVRTAKECYRPSGRYLRAVVARNLRRLATALLRFGEMRPSRPVCAKKSGSTARMASGGWWL